MALFNLHDAPDSKVWQAHLRLQEAYGEQAIYARLDPMHELIATVLSHRTTHANEVAAYRRMRERFPTWEAVRDAPLPDLIETIRPSNYPEVKAPYIQKILTRILDERGEANLDFLHEYSTEQAMAWLTSLPGVGLKTATLLLLFNFQKPVLPVDTHVHRVTLRLGVLAPKTSADKAHALLLTMLPAEPRVLFNFHKHFYWHGQRVCVWGQPVCSQCVLRDLCDYYHSTGSKA
jgi:endonuclease-3